MSPILPNETSKLRAYEEWCDVASSTESRPSQAAEREVFERRDEKVLASILLHSKTSQLSHIKAGTFSAEAWNKLKQIHYQKAKAEKRYFQKNFYICEYKKERLILVIYINFLK